ncbi:hypothetical protein [Mariprofundus ferrooxydans]|uniref:hypothetical protein n=1 Tax=Mariprofundus ferrooxydans TaxID=314344 RepID=UPI00143174E2|nr:hypothetical protein [Mariprofundus ferrooxydans]
MSAHSDKAARLTVEHLPTAPASAVRLRFFQTSCRPVHTTTAWIATPWGQCRVTGRIGQIHANLIDTIMHTAERVFVEPAPDGRMQLLVDPYRVRQIIGGGRQYSYEGMCRHIDEIMGCMVEWETKVVRGKGHIIDSCVESKVTKSNPLGGRRGLWKITIGEAWTRLIRDDFSLYYDPAKVAGLRHGVSQAFARVVLSHDAKRWNKGGIKVSTVFDWLGIQTGQPRRKALFHIKSDSAGLAEIGFHIDDGYVKRGES